MKNCLRHSINDRFYIEATMDGSKTQHENFEVITVKLYAEDEHVVVAKKKFLWPERCLPTEITMDNAEKVVILKGIGNIAKIPLRIQQDKCSLFVGTSEKSALSVSIYPSLSSSDKVEPNASLAAQISDCLTLENSDLAWNSLSKLARRADVSSFYQLPVTVSEHVQLRLIKILRKRIDDKHFDRVLTFLIHSRLITTSRTSCKLIELLVDESFIPQTIDFVRSSLILDDRAYALCLKISSNKQVSKSWNLLLALLEKPINYSGLCHAISQNLTEMEVIILIERLISLSCDTDKEDIFDKILKLEAVLVDSHSQRFIWDEKCHSAVQDAACSVAAMAQLVNLFRHLEQGLEQTKKSADDLSGANSDYIIRKINFVQKLI